MEEIFPNKDIVMSIQMNQPEEDVFLYKKITR